MENYKNPISLFKQTNFSKTIWWKLKVNISGYQNEKDDNLVTEIFKNRFFRLLYPNIYQHNHKFSRILVQLYEDGYVCWINLNGLIIEKYELRKTENIKNEHSFIKDTVPSILRWIKDQAELNNEYLWGGTLGPNFDCSGLIQSAFASAGIWIPRDAYQQEKFCNNIVLDIESLSEKIIPGDLIFFGSSGKCTHVGLHIENGFYIHSSGVTNGHNGIEIDGLFHPKLGEIASFYRSKFRSAGRVISCYQSEKL